MRRRSSPIIRYAMRPRGAPSRRSNRRPGRAKSPDRPRKKRKPDALFGQDSAILLVRHKDGTPAAAQVPACGATTRMQGRPAKPEEPGVTRPGSLARQARSWKRSSPLDQVALKQGKSEALAATGRTKAAVVADSSGPRARRAVKCPEVGLTPTTSQLHNRRQGYTSHWFISLGVERDFRR